jgi:aryl-alcohol dehydrogenase-like predicted oxidoreductase
VRYTTFGRNNRLRVSEYGLGTANFGTGWSAAGGWGPGAEPAEARKIFDRFAEAGGTLIDTAENYHTGESQLLGEFLGADRDHFVLTGKYSISGVGPQNVSNTGNSRRYMVKALEASLRRLNTGHLDMYWVHASDGLTPWRRSCAAWTS